MRNRSNHVVYIVSYGSRITEENRKSTQNAYVHWLLKQYKNAIGNKG